MVHVNQQSDRRLPFEASPQGHERAPGNLSRNEGLHLNHTSC